MRINKMSIECDRCKKEIIAGEKVKECTENDVIGRDLTELSDTSNIHRFCIKCWDEIIEFLLSEGKL